MNKIIACMLKLICLTSTLLLIFFLDLNAQELDSARLSQLNQDLQLVIDADKKADCYSAIASLYYDAYEYEMAGIYYDSSLNYFVQPSNERMEILKKQSFVLLQTNEHRKSLLMLDELIPYLLTQKDSLLLCKCFDRKAYNLMKLSQPDVAVTYFLQSLECFESIGNQRSVAIELNHLSSILFQMEEDEKAMYYSKKAYQLAIELMDTAIIASTASNLAIRYAYLSKPDTAFFYANLSLDLARKGQSETRISYAYLRMALINIDLKDYDQVIAYADSALAINPKYRGVVTGLKYKAQAYLAQNNLNQANICIEEAIEVAQQGDDLEVIFVLHQIASDVYERRGMHVSALEQYKIYSSLKDSVLNIEKLAKMESLLAKYESEKTAQQIAQLIQQNEINDLKNKQQYLIFFLISVFLIVIGLTAFFVLKQRMNKQHAQMAIKKEQLLRSQINPHFIFNALSSIRGFLFEKNGFKNAIDYLGKFAKLMRMVLDHSAKELVTLEEEINALRIYFDIQKMRFNSTFDYCMSIDPNIALDQVKVPPLMAQPFVENSIEHGFKNIDYHGEIEFSCKQDGMFIRFSISDNGVGIHHVKGGQDHESRALEIFKERMELIRNQFKMKLTFLIRDLGETGAKSGTKIEYTLPISQI